MNKYRVPVQFEAENDEDAKRIAAILTDVMMNLEPVAPCSVTVFNGELQRESAYWDRVR